MDSAQKNAVAPAIESVYVDGGWVAGGEAVNEERNRLASESVGRWVAATQ